MDAEVALMHGLAPSISRTLTDMSYRLRVAACPYATVHKLEKFQITATGRTSASLSTERLATG